MATPREIAQWMCQELDRCEYLSQKHAAQTIQSRFGPEYVCTNRNGNLAITKAVLKAFRELCPDVVFRGTTTWRKRQAYDAPGRRQRSLTQAEFEAKTGTRQI